MFGLSFGELVVLVVVAIVVVGPRELPRMLRTAGTLIGRLRRLAVEVRGETGIDSMEEVEALRKEVARFRRLASGEIDLDAADEPEPLHGLLRGTVNQSREWPRIGCDAYGALSEDEAPYAAAHAAAPVEPMTVASSG